MKRETLPSALERAGVGLEVLTSYTTQPHPQLTEQLDKVVGQFGGGKTLCAVFFSPSGVEFALEKLVSMCKSTSIEVCYMKPAEEL